MKKILVKNARLVNEGKTVDGDVLINGGLIEKIGASLSDAGARELNAGGNYLFPGVIDDQVHFRDPGLTHKGDLATESRAAVAGGITTFMEMPNTIPNTLTQELLEEKYRSASVKSVANFSFFMGASNDNLEEVLKTDANKVCGIKVFMGSSTGNMLVDNEKTLDRLFSTSPMLIATHCEDEQTIRRNQEIYRQKYGEDVPIQMHPLIRNEEACYLSSSMAVALAKKHRTRLHILHISTAKELSLFDGTIPLKDKRITAEACIHHLWFDDRDYEELGTKIKWNPAIKTRQDREALLKGLLENKLDIVATDHAPHTMEEKNQKYFQAPSGGPLVQHSLVAMLELVHQDKLTVEKVAEKMSHAVAECFQIQNRGYIREGYAADLVLVNLNDPWTVNRSNILAKCGWSPFEGVTFRSKVIRTFVNGNVAYEQGNIHESVRGERILFNR